MTKHPVVAWGLPLALAVLMMAGCGDGRPKRVPVSGRVLIDGQPLQAGYIRLIPEGARPSGSEIDSKGRFTLTCFDGEDGAVLGTHRVEVSAREQINALTTKIHAPKKYSSAETSGITVEITEPTDDLTIELTWDGGEPYEETLDQE